METEELKTEEITNEAASAVSAEAEAPADTAGTAEAAPADDAQADKPAPGETMEDYAQELEASFKKSMREIFSQVQSLESLRQRSRWTLDTIRMALSAWRTQAMILLFR